MGDSTAGTITKGIAAGAAVFLVIDAFRNSGGPGDIVSEWILTVATGAGPMLARMAVVLGAIAGAMLIVGVLSAIALTVSILSCEDDEDEDIDGLTVAAAATNLAALPETRDAYAEMQRPEWWAARGYPHTAAVLAEQSRAPRQPLPLHLPIETLVAAALRPAGTITTSRAKTPPVTVWRDAQGSYYCGERGHTFPDETGGTVAVPAFGCVSCAFAASASTADQWAPPDDGERPARSVFGPDGELRPYVG